MCCKIYQILDRVLTANSTKGDISLNMQMKISQHYILQRRMMKFSLLEVKRDYKTSLFEQSPQDLAHYIAIHSYMIEEAATAFVSESQFIVSLYLFHSYQFCIDIIIANASKFFFLRTIFFPPKITFPFYNTYS